MSYIEKLRKSRDKAQVAYQEFCLRTGKAKEALFCFFEGKDNDYYVPRIKQFTNNYEPIKCGGREKVLEVHRLIKNQVEYDKYKKVLEVHRLIKNRAEYDKYKKAFFIDRDFNPPLPTHNPPIFETPCYSIENLYVSVGVFKEILKNVFSLSEVSDRDYEVCLTLFVERQKEFHLAVTLLNSWYACSIDIRNADGRQTGVNLGDKLPKNFINFTLASVSSNYDLAKIKQTFPNALEVTEEALNKKLSQFSNCQCHKEFRGKYEIQFLLALIELILRDARETKNYLKNQINFSFGDKLSNEQAISIFSGYAETPESLIAYLKQVTESESSNRQDACLRKLRTKLKAILKTKFEDGFCWFI